MGLPVPLPSMFQVEIGVRVQHVRLKLLSKKQENDFFDSGLHAFSTPQVYRKIAVVREYSCEFPTCEP